MRSTTATLDMEAGRDPAGEGEMAAQFVVEEGGNDRQYHKVHVAGCRDLRDPEPIGEASDWESLLEAAQGMYGEDEFDSMRYLKSVCPPCVRAALGGAAS